MDYSGIVKDETRPTIIKSRVLSQGQQLLRIDWEKDTNISKDIQDKIVENIKKNIDNIDAILLSDYDKGVLTKYVSEEIIKLARKYDKKIIVDPKPKNFKNYVGATSMTPNKKEILDYCGLKKFNIEKEISEAMAKIKEELKLDCLVLTRSEEGMTLFEDGAAETISTVAKEE